MSYLQAVVYDPPSGDYPPVIIIFKPDGEILAACAASSHEEAENFLADVEAKVEATRHIERSPKIC
jgi:hypothetical protein